MWREELRPKPRATSAKHAASAATSPSFETALVSNATRAAAPRAVLDRGGKKMPHDHKVTYTTEDTLARIATNWRKRHGSENKYSFDITEFIETTLKSGLKGKSLKIEFYDRDFDQDDPAYVDFDPTKSLVTLWVDRQIWKRRNQVTISRASCWRMK
jgi:hypothetical protein